MKDDTAPCATIVPAATAPVIKSEPDTEPEPIESIESEPLPDLPPSTVDEADAQNLDLPANFAEDLAGMLEAYNANHSQTEVRPDAEVDYQDALEAVETVRSEIATTEALGEPVSPDLHIRLQSLEGALYQAGKLRRKAQDAEQRQLEEDENLMFFTGAASGEDEIALARAPTRGEATGAPVPGEQVQLFDDSDSGRAPRTGRGGKKSTRGGRSKSSRKVPATKGKTRVQKRSAASRGRGRGSRPSDFGNLNMASLRNNNIVQDAQVNQTLGAQPTFAGATSKKAALDRLISSIPKDQQSVTHGMRTKLDRACRRFAWKGQGSMKPDAQGGWKLKGMSSSLKHFQLLGAAWGVERELSESAPFGGILADTMGYGKTVQMITIMVENQPKIRAKNQTTLVVLPSSIVHQWLAEIAKHTEDKIMENVYIYKSGGRVLAGDTCRFLSRFQVVLTTYPELMRQYPVCAPPLELVTEKAKDEWWEAYYNKTKGPLLSMPFYRVVLDEAQIIKNHESRTSKACRLLTAKYKWALTGTPISNCMEELYPYFEFLGVEGAGSYAQFRANYCKRNDTTMQRLDAMLGKVMLRRTGADRLFGAPLTSLPALDHATIEVSFNPVEKAIYSVVRARFIARINDWSTSGKIQQLTRNIFVMLTRLRQMCSHVLMIGSCFKDILEAEDIEKLWETIKRHSDAQGPAGDDPGTKTATILKRIYKEASDEHIEAGSTPAPPTGVPDTVDLTIDDGDFGFRGLFYRLVQLEGSWDNIRARSHCNQCNDIPERAKLSIPCGHLYCEECIKVLLESASASNMNTAQCTFCHGPVTGSADMTAMERIAAEADNYPSRALGTPPGIGNGRKRRKATPANEAWLSMPDIEKLSTKVQAVASTMQKWIREDPNAKIVVFTLFLPIITVLGKVCAKNGWGYAEFTGKVKAEIRNAALNGWKDAKEDQKVLLMSMRAGGLGLNLVEASYVIIVDPWWNEPAEDQAFSRVYRIGQQRDCVVRRFVIADAIDTQLMLHLQKLKAQECDRVVDGRSNQELSIPDLMRLFGPTRRDPETGEMIIDDEGGDEEFVLGQDLVVVDDSDVEETLPAPARPRE